MSLEPPTAPIPVPRHSRPLPRIWLLLALIPPLLLGLAILFPFFLINTEPGRFLIRAMANSSDQGHLALQDAHLQLWPGFGLELKGIKLANPFDQQAPTMGLRLLKVEGLRVQETQEGRIMESQRASLHGVRLEAWQRWVDLHQDESKPPQLPPLFPMALRTPLVEVEDTGYVIHQTRRGQATRTRMAGISARLEDFEWNARTLAIKGHGRLSATLVDMNGMLFDHLDIPEFRAENGMLIIPRGYLTGMGGSVVISGKMLLKGAAPRPDLHILAKDLDLPRVVAAGGGHGGGPVGRINLDARLSGGGPKGVGEAPEPDLVGTIELEDFSVPVREKGKLSAKIVAKVPGYTPGPIPRMNLGTLRGGIKVADGYVHLQQLTVDRQGMRITIHGTVEQGTERLNLRMWVVPLRPGDGAPVGETIKERISSLVTDRREALEARHAAPEAGTTPAATPTSTSSSAPPVPVATALASPSPGAPSPSPEATPLSKRDARRAELEAKAAAVKADLDAKREEARRKAEEVKTDIELRREEVKTELEARRETAEQKAEALRTQAQADAAALKEKVQAKVDEVLPEEVKAARDRAQAKVADVKADVAEVKAGMEARREDRKEKLEEARAEAKDRWSERLSAWRARVEAMQLELFKEVEEKLGAPTLCITGTTANPIMGRCEEE